MGHPINAGLWLGLAGTATASGEIGGFLGVTLAFAAWLAKARTKSFSWPGSVCALIVSETMARPIAAMARGLDRDLHAVRQCLRQPVDAGIARGGLTGRQRLSEVVASDHVREYLRAAKPTERKAIIDGVRALRGLRERHTGKPR